MSGQQDLSHAQIAFELAGGDPDQFIVTQYQGSEGLCRLYRVEIDLICRDESVVIEDVVGRPAVLSVNTEFGVKYFHGLVGRLDLIDDTLDQFYYRAQLMPAAWLLTHRYGCRIFQHQSSVDIILKVLHDAGISADRVDTTRLLGSYGEREYCVQYRETDYHFISRLMEDEGIRWYFEHDENSHTLILADGGDYAPIESDEKLPYHQPTGLNVSREHVSRFRAGRSVRPGSVVLGDFNFKNPSHHLESQSDAGTDRGLEISDYPGNFDQLSRGQDVARLRAESLDTGRSVAAGISNSPRMAVGKSFVLTDHPSPRLNGAYLLTSITHSGRQAACMKSTGTGSRFRRHAFDQLPFDTSWLYHAGEVTRDSAAMAGAAGLDPLTSSHAAPFDASGEGERPSYTCRFDAIPASVTYRPPLVTARPVVRGSQTARVTGPDGETIYTDKYGRVKVQFPWDREGSFNENSSCWIRVSQGMAGGQYGMMFLPRVGQEVVIDFMEGDPDKPVITGRVFNADHMPPYSLPDERSKSVIKTHSLDGSGCNELRFDDAAGAEQILIQAQRDHHLRVKNDLVESVEANAHRQVTGDQRELVKGNRDMETRLDCRAEVGGNRSLSVSGDVNEECKGHLKRKVGSNYALKAGSEIVIDAGSALTLKVGGNFIKIDSSGIHLNGAKVNLNCSGSAAGVAPAASMQQPQAPDEADKAHPGRDVDYAGGTELAPMVIDPDTAGRNFRTSWIEVELVDEEGRPVAGESFEVMAPDAETVITGSLDANGLARVSVPEEGMCQVSFPNLDLVAWEKTS